MVLQHRQHPSVLFRCVNMRLPIPLGWLVEFPNWKARCITVRRGGDHSVSTRQPLQICLHCQRSHCAGGGCHSTIFSKRPDPPQQTTPHLLRGRNASPQNSLALPSPVFPQHPAAVARKSNAAESLLRGVSRPSIGTGRLQGHETMRCWILPYTSHVCWPRLPADHCVPLHRVELQSGRSHYCCFNTTESRHD